MSIKIKKHKNKVLSESPINLGNITDTPDITNSAGISITRTQNRANELLRIAAESELAAEKADTQGQTELAGKLRAQATELRTIAQTGLGSEAAAKERRKQLAGGKNIEIDDEPEDDKPSVEPTEDNGTKDNTNKTANPIDNGNPGTETDPGTNNSKNGQHPDGQDVLDDIIDGIENSKDKDPNKDSKSNGGSDKKTNSNPDNIDDGPGGDGEPNDEKDPTDSKDNKGKNNKTSDDEPGNEGTEGEEGGESEVDGDPTDSGKNNKGKNNKQDDGTDGGEGGGDGEPDDSGKEGSENDGTNDDGTGSEGEDDDGGDNGTDGTGTEGNEEDPGNENEPNNSSSNSQNNNTKQQSNKRIVKNPFEQKETGGGLPEDGGADEAEDASVDDIIKILKRLPKRAKDGARDGIADLLSKKKESLTNIKTPINEALNIHDAGEDEFNSYVNKALDLIDQVKKVHINQKRDNDLIQDIVNDPLSQKMLDDEENSIIDAETAAVKAREREAQKYSASTSSANVAAKIAAMVQSQLPEPEYETDSSWTKFNAKAYSRGVIKKGNYEHETEDKYAVEIDLFFDMSGSWCDNPNAIKAGEDIVGALGKYEEDGDLKVNVYYFSSILTTDRHNSDLGGGTRAWSKIIAKIEERKQACKKAGAIGPNVVLLTDGDMEDQAENSAGITTNGFVWIILNASDYGPVYGNDVRIWANNIINKLNSTRGKQVSILKL